MLRIGGIINIGIAIIHIIGLFWAKKMFKVTGIANDMAELSQIHASLPYILTLIVSIAFLIFGLYGLSADDKFRKLPFLKVGIFIIALIYMLRGASFFIIITAVEVHFLEVLYSLIALVIGLMYLIGGFKKWYKR